ncbi:RagB/SusD family nutrient uptake outer membrane protein [Pelobium manganitolerans]|uniref:RagB/SusD family nutrient uptake outer membrane protein n=1 Tax=Pelobium manganitolerans TaxID=1842495 RepID=UPI003FA35D5B
MKNNFNKYIKGACIILLGASVITSCVNSDDFFELPDRNGLDAAIWSTEGAIQFHLNKAYDVVIPEFGYEQLGTTQLHARAGIHYASDESFLPFEDEYALAALGLGGEPLGNNSVWYVGDKYSSNKGENKYSDISRCNDAIYNIPKGTLPRSVQKVYLGQYYALRAMVYFGLVKVYGGVPLVLEPQTPDNITVSGRASAKECFTAIINDLDSAIVMLDGLKWDDGTGRGKLTKAAASALKGKVMLYWASPQFNPKDDGKHAYDPSRWNQALVANKQAYEDCLAAGHKLSDPGTYGDIFRVEPNPEAIIVRTYSSTLPKRGHNIEQEIRPKSEGGDAKKRYRPSYALINAYPMKDGSIPGSGKYAYSDVTFWVNRDPRFAATIAYNGASWPLSGKADRKQWGYAGASGESSADNGVFCKRFSTPALATGSVKYNGDIGGGSGMDWIEMRFAEVILNYAECANETGDLGLAKDLVRQIRVRAGIEKGDKDYGLADANQDQMRELIFNERFIEFAFENKRNSDLRRMRRMHLLSGNLTSVSFEAKDDDAKKALEKVDPASGKMLRETLNLNDESVYLQYFLPPISVTEANRTYNVPAYHVFYTFHNDFVYTGKDIKPTVGWAGGTFDPLD